jgi:hypothetical protein
MLRIHMYVSPELLKVIYIKFGFRGLHLSLYFSDPTDQIQLLLNTNTVFLEPDHCRVHGCMTINPINQEPFIFVSIPYTGVVIYLTYQVTPCIKVLLEMRISSAGQKNSHILRGQNINEFVPSNSSLNSINRLKTNQLDTISNAKL